MLRQGKKRDAIEVWHYLQDRASSLPPRPSGRDAGSAANSVKPTRADVERASAVKKVFTLPPNYTNKTHLLRPPFGRVKAFAGHVLRVLPRCMHRFWPRILARTLWQVSVWHKLRVLGSSAICPTKCGRSIFLSTVCCGRGAARKSSSSIAANGSNMGTVMRSSLPNWCN